MAENIATRAAYGQALVELADQYPELVVLDADLSGSTMTKAFAEAYPDRFFNMGIAEGNMAGVAAGLAASGKKQFHRLPPAECKGHRLPRRPVRGRGRGHPSVH